MTDPYEIITKRISLGEAITAATALYLCTIAAFNAGYFLNIPGHFLELFSFSDLIGVNIEILQYFFLVFTAYCTISIFLSWAIKPIWKRFKPKIDDLILLHLQDNTLFNAAFFVMLAVFLLLLILIDFIHNTIFSVELFPFAAFHGVLVYVFWVGYSTFEVVRLKTLLVILFLNLFMLSYESGKIWLKYDILLPAAAQAIQLNDNTCIERKLLRANSTGYLLYSFSLKQYEFRSKDSVRTIFSIPGCI